MLEKVQNSLGEIGVFCVSFTEYNFPEGVYRVKKRSERKWLRLDEVAFPLGCPRLRLNVVGPAFE